VWNLAWKLPIGGNIEQAGTRFRIWAPAATKVAVVIVRPIGESRHFLTTEHGGYWEALIPDVAPGSRYWFEIDETRYPDPASRSQPDGVHGASELVDPDSFPWNDSAWCGLEQSDWVIYELHVGTFTPEGTFDSAIDRLEHLVRLGVTAVEVMPIASFAGDRNWGYDGVSLYAPAACYGGPDAFRRFVDAAHRAGLAVILDVVYNHLGPDGNYLPAITGGKLFNAEHKTSWGDAINYDGDDSAPVRELVIANALYWAHEFHVDGLRLDATHAIADDSRTHILAEIARELHALTPRRIVIAEDERNDRRLISEASDGGLGLDAVWADDFHHQARRLLAGDSDGYFSAFSGSAQDLATTLANGWFYEGQWSPHTNAPRGTPTHGIPARAFVHCIQNHDQVGNRPLGDRLNHTIDSASYRAISTLLLLSPYTPMLWMGQEWAASTPFLYFTDHNAELGQLVTKGRREEFSDFPGFANDDELSRIPDPQDVATFERSRLQWGEIDEEPHRGMLELYRAVLAIRREELRFDATSDREFEAMAKDEETIVLQHRLKDGRALAVIARLGGAEPASFADLLPPAPAGRQWKVLLCSEESRFGGDGQTSSLPGAGAVVVISS
jgi:maltooligosyltrehalose trehalohydrolase